MIEAEKATYPIAWMCRLLDVPRSSCYAWRRQVAGETATAVRRRQLGEHVARVFAAGRGVYGCRRVTAQLNREGHPCSVGLVADLMRELGLAAVQPGAYNRTTVAGQHPVSSPDLIGRDFTGLLHPPGYRRMQQTIATPPTDYAGPSLATKLRSTGQPSSGHRQAQGLGLLAFFPSFLLGGGGPRSVRRGLVSTAPGRSAHTPATARVAGTGQWGSRAGSTPFRAGPEGAR